MSNNWFALLELLLVFGAVFGFGWHQLRDLKKYKDKSPEADDDA